MNESTLNALATARPAELRFKTFRAANERIKELEAQLGLPHWGKSFGVHAANERVNELERMLGSKATPFAAAVAPAVSMLAKFLALPAADQDRWSEMGNAFDCDSFNLLSPAARVRHHALGGKITAPDSSRTVRIVSPDPLPENNGIIALSVFQKLGRNDQANLIRLGVKIGREQSANYRK